jgi:hypothetical protein
MLLAYCRLPLCKKLIFGLEAHLEDGYVRILRAEFTKPCCLDSYNVAMKALPLSVNEWSVRMQKPIRLDIEDLE